MSYNLARFDLVSIRMAIEKSFTQGGLQFTDATACRCKGQVGASGRCRQAAGLGAGHRQADRHQIKPGKVVAHRSRPSAIIFRGTASGFRRDRPPAQRHAPWQPVQGAGFFCIPGRMSDGLGAGTERRGIGVLAYRSIGVSQGDVPGLVIDPDPAQPRSTEKPDSGFSIRVADDGGLAAR